VNAKKIILPVLLVLVGLAVWRFGFANGKDPNRLLLHGNIELTEVNLSFKSSGRLVERPVDEGSFVKQGDLIARLDTTEAERTLERDRASLTSSETLLPQLRTSIDYQSESIAGDLQLKKADLAQAEARLAELTAGSRPQEKQQAKSAVDEARTQSVQATADWERAQTLYKNDDISRAQYDQYKARYDATAALLRRAEETQALVVEGPRKEQIDAARAQVERAKAAVRLSEAGRIDLKRREQEISTRKADIDRARAQTQVLETQLKDRVIYSPVNAVVLTKSAEIGEVLAAGATVLTLGDIERPWVRGYVGEKDLGRVKLGMPVEVTTDSFPGKKYDGKITFISSQAEFTPKTIQTTEERVKLVYRIKVELPNPNQELKLNMPVDAEIRLQ
jgi:HlyD family secretion protein